MIDLSISGETLTNNILFLFIKNKKCISVMCCKDFKEISSRDYKKFQLYLY